LRVLSDIDYFTKKKVPSVRWNNEFYGLLVFFAKRPIFRESYDTVKLRDSHWHSKNFFLWLYASRSWENFHSGKSRDGLMKRIKDFMCTLSDNIEIFFWKSKRA
jgi:hypothetical protein